MINKKQISFIILLIIGLSLIIGNASATRYYEAPCTSGNHTHMTNWTEELTSHCKEGVVKYKGSYYKKYYDEYVNDGNCYDYSAHDSGYYYDYYFTSNYSYEKYAPNEVVKTKKTPGYLKSIEAKEKVYNIYKIKKQLYMEIQHIILLFITLRN